MWKQIFLRELNAYGLCIPYLNVELQKQKEKNLLTYTVTIKSWPPSNLQIHGAIFSEALAFQSKLNQGQN